jgi:bifunctional DNase/RNase
MLEEEAPVPTDDLVPVAPIRVVIDESEDGQHLFFLRETNGDAVFPIAAGFCEAAALDRLLRECAGQAFPLRPLTHELLLNAIEALQGRVERAIITRLENETFFARIVVRREEADLHLDARPSDAVCVALQAGAPLYVLRGLLDSISGEV